MIMDKFVENGKLESALSKWCDFLPMEAKFSTKKSGEPVNARILDLQAKFEFLPGEPLTPYNLNRFIPVFNYRCMPFNGYKKEDSPQHYEKDLNEGHEVEYLICNDNKRRRISTENGFSAIKRIQEIKAEDRRIFPPSITNILSSQKSIKSCTHEVKVQDFFSWSMVRSTV